MSFDLPTSMTITSLLTFGVGASLTFAASRYPVALRGTMRVWIGGLFLQAFALLAPALLAGTPPSGMLIVASNLVYALAYAEMGRATALFAGRARSWLPLLLVAAVTVNSFCFSVLWPHQGWRVGLNAAPLATLQFAVAWSILHGRATLRPADYLTGSLFIACAALAIARGVIELLGPTIIPRDAHGAVSNVVFVFSSTLPMLATIGFMLMCVDRLNDDLSRLAMIDPLTGVYNRRTLAGFAETAIADADRLHLPLALLAIDVDHFKQINDEYGHDAGDEALLGLIERMRDALGADVMLSRIGGEEFAVLLPGMDEAEASAIAERMRRHVAGSPLLLAGGHALTLQVSIGIATLADSAHTLHDLLREADRALYAAKHAGRNRCVTRSSLALAPGNPPLDVISR